MILEHWLALYVVVSLGWASSQKLIHGSEDVVLAVMFAWLIAIVWVGIGLIWPFSPKIRKAFRGPTLTDFGGRAGAERLMKDLVGPGD